MELVIGGYSQGKLNYVLNNYDKNVYQVYDGASLALGTLEKIATENKVVILDHFHCWVKERIRQGEDPESEIMDFLDQRSEDLVITVMRSETGSCRWMPLRESTGREREGYL